MGNITEGLNVRELLKKTYSVLTKRHNPQEIVLPDKALTEIANDSDWHRTRVGSMSYESAGLFQSDEKTWAIARGKKCGGYPAEPYDSDILALELSAEGKTPEQIQEELREGIEGSSYFKNTLILGMADGNLAFGKKGRFTEEMSKILNPEIERFTARKPEYDSRYLSLSTLSSICKSSVRYKREFAGFLADSIEAVLEI